MKRIAIITGCKISEPDVDEPLLLSAFEKLGGRAAEASVVAWDSDPDMSVFDVAVIRSTWNYVPVRDAFCDWVDRTAKVTRIFNSPSIIRWSTDKSYLAELQGRGVRIVPTSFARTIDDIAWTDVVIKPRIGAASFATQRFTLPRDRERARRFLDEHRDRAMMIQPYMHDVDARGERSLVFIDDRFTHAVRKSPRFADGSEHVSEAVDIADEELDVANRAIEPFRDELLYARVDVIRDESDRVCLMELELVEPSLFLRQHVPSADRLAAATLSRFR